MITFPNAKINLGLFVTEKRDDGYHEIETALYPVNIFDAVEIVPSNEFSFKAFGIDIPYTQNDNLCVMAYRLMQKRYNIPSVQLQLLKSIPIGAGLGGGSADAAFTLKLLRDKFIPEVNDEDLMEMATQLGSDCPFFVKNVPALATGRGEVLNAIELSLKGKYLVLIYPDIHVSTAEAYKGIIPKSALFNLKNLKFLGLQEWKEHLKNDFEEGIFKKHPEIEEVKEKLYEAGASFALMSGSGSSVYGIFENKPANITAFPGSRVFIVALD